MASIVCWYKCDHTAPVFEEDILSSKITVNNVVVVNGGRLMNLDIEVFAERGGQAPEAGADIKVLEWKLAVLTGG